MATQRKKRFHGREPLEELYDKIFSIPLISQNDVIKLFRRLDSYVLETVYYLARKSNYVEGYLADVVCEILGDLTGGRTVFRSSKKKKEDFEKRFVSRVSVFFHAVAIGNKHALVHGLKKLYFSRLIWEDLIESFLAETRDYHDLCSSISAELASLHVADGQVQVSEKLSVLFSEIERVERATGCAGNTLYFLVMKIDELWRRCQKVRERIIKAYLRIAFRESLKRSYGEHQVFDNFQNGYFGVVRATSSYDSDIGVSFGSYARHWVRQSIWFGLKKESGVSQHFWNLYSRIERARTAIVSEGDEATTKAISARTGITKKRIERTTRIRQASNLCSLDHASPFDERTLYQKLEDQEATEAVAQGQIVEDVAILLEDLDPEALRVVALKHGLFDRLPGKDTVPESDVVKLLAKHILREAKS